MTKHKVLVEAVYDLMHAHWQNGELRKLLESVDNESALSGSFILDRGLAAHELKQIASNEGVTVIDEAKHTAVMSAIETCLRRAGLGRRQRLTALA